MEQLIEKRYKSLQKLMGFLAANKLVGKTKFNYSVLLADLYHLNKIIYDSYIIFNSKVSRQNKIVRLTALTNREGRPFLTEHMANIVLDKYAKGIKQFYSRFYKKQQGGNIETFKSIGKEAIDWVFFPLYKLENLPMAGNLVGIPLDIIGVMIDNVDIIMELLGPFIPTALSLLADLGSAIPIPGVNTGFAGLSIATTLGAKPLEYVLENGLDVVSLFLNISRKQWGLAYLSAMEAIPAFPALMDATVTNLYTINKYVDKAKYLSEVTLNNVSVLAPIANEILTNPSILTQPVNFIQKIVLPNKHLIPILNRYPIEEALPAIANIQDKLVDVYSNGVNSQTIQNYIPNQQQLINYAAQRYIPQNNYVAQ